MRQCIMSVVCTLLLVAAVHADDRERTLYAAATAETQRWQQASHAMTADDYARSVDNNQDIIQQGLQHYSERLREHAGALAPTLDLVGAVVAVAAHDRRYSLNDSRTVGMVLRDTASSDRTLLFEYRTAW